jgi:cell division protein FtsW (lipid II flippase)
MTISIAGSTPSLIRRPIRWARGTTSFRRKIALGSGGWSGKGFMQGTQSRLNFLPEKHTDFIFTTLAEEFGFIGAFSLLMLYALIIFFCSGLCHEVQGPVLGNC